VFYASTIVFTPDCTCQNHLVSTTFCVRRSYPKKCEAVRFTLSDLSNTITIIVAALTDGKLQGAPCSWFLGSRKEVPAQLPRHVWGTACCA
jgi:hypothetical protein